jgi:hypothetical protein
MLEDAHERNETAVSRQVAAAVADRVPQIVNGMLIVDAIELVLRSQETWLAPASSDHGGLEGVGALPAAPPLDAESARALTEEIRRTGHQVCFLLLEAHQRRAWQALGYRTWEHYIRSELGMSRSRSYEMIDQGRVIMALRAVTGSSALPQISPYTARRIKPHLREVLETVSRSANRAMPEGLLTTIGEVLAAKQAGSGAPSDTPLEPQVEFGRAQCGHFEADVAMAVVIDGNEILAAIDLIAGMPPAEEIVSQFPMPEVPDVRAVDMAARWLANLAGVLREHPSLCELPSRAS